MLPPVILPDTDTVVPVKLVALTLAPPRMLPPVMLPAALIKPGVVMLPPAIFDVTFSALTTFELKLRPAAFRLPPVMLPDVLIVPDPAAMLPPVMVPLAAIVPITLNPVGAKTTTFEVPLTLTVILALGAAILTFDVPLLMLATLVIIPLNSAPLPRK